MSYTAFTHPSRSAELFRPLTPKERWKREHHNARYTLRYGEPPKLFKVELGTIDRFRFIPTKPA